MSKRISIKMQKIRKNMLYFRMLMMGNVYFLYKDG